MVLVSDDTARKYGGFYLSAEAPACRYTFRMTQVPGVMIRLGIDITNPYIFGSGGEARFNADLQLSSLVSRSQISESLRSEDAYEDIHNYICETDRQHLKTSILSAAQSPDGGFLNHRGLEGFRVVPAGQVFHLIPCEEVSVGKGNAPYCTNEMPVLYNGALWFRDPLSKILKMNGTRIPCDPITPACWDVSGSWYCGYPELRPGPDPLQLAPRDPQIGKAATVDLSQGQGWYSAEELEKNRMKMMFEDTRPGVPSALATAAVLGTSPGSGLIEAVQEGIGPSLRAIAEETAYPMTYWMGSWKIIVYVVIAVVPATLAFLACCIRCSILYKVRGCGVHLCAAINETLTLILMVPIRLLGSVSTSLVGLFKEALHKHEQNQRRDPETGIRMKVRDQIAERAEDRLLGRLASASDIEI